MKKISKIIAMLTVAIILITAMIIPASAASKQYLTGRMASGWTSPHTVYLTNTKKDAKIKVTFYKTSVLQGLPNANKGKACSAKIRIRMTDAGGHIIWEGKKSVPKSGVTLKLGHDHSYYRIQFYDAGTLGDNVPSYWCIECSSNCTVQ